MIQKCLRIVLAFPLLLLLHLPVRAQVAVQCRAILDDPDVVWAAVVDLTFWIDPEFTAPDSVYAKSSHSTLLKAINTDPNPEQTGPLLLADRIFRQMTDERVAVYLHPDSLQALTAEQRHQMLNIHDTVTVIDPVTFQETTQTILNCFWSESVQRVRVRQLLFYRDKTDDFEVYTLAYAPLLRRNTAPGEFYYFSIPFWFKMPAYNAKDAGHVPDLHDKNISWARRMITGTNLPSLDDLKPLKNLKQPVMNQCFSRATTDAKYEVLQGFDWKPLTPQLLTQQLMSEDTIITFDPETYEERVMIEKTAVQGADAMSLRLVQDWFWDERRSRPIFRLYAFAPLKKVFDDNENFRFLQPVFWRKVTPRK
jgi:hypothetical protein